MSIILKEIVKILKTLMFILLYNKYSGILMKEIKS